MANLVAMLRLPSNLKSTQWQILAGPILILLILSMMVLPLPAFILDLLFTFNIALSIMVLLVAMFTQRTLDFAAFPTILLFTTLLRLALNVASTRIILMEGHTRRRRERWWRRSVISVGGNFAIGIVVFIILVIINFMVITKGAGRIAEVGARFVLDGMPGKQMAIDADLNAGLIGEDEAKNGVRKSLRKPTSTARWTGQVNLCAATPSPVFSSWSLTWSAGCWSAYCSTE